MSWLRGEKRTRLVDGDNSSLTMIASFFLFPATMSWFLTVTSLSCQIGSPSVDNKLRTFAIAIVKVEFERSNGHQ